MAKSSDSPLLSRKIKDIAGQKFGRITALSYAGSDKNGNAKWNCRCDCGVEKTILGQSLRSGKVVSCKCYSNELATKSKLTHGLSSTAYYKAWFGMLQRCENKNHTAWKRYGGRGIKVCERWHAFENFLADMGQRPEGATIERVENNGNYEPGNCCWATRSEQQNNRSTNRIVEVDGIKMTFAQAAKKFNIEYGTARSRLKSNWSVDTAFKTPTKQIKVDHGITQ